MPAGGARLRGRSETDDTAHSQVLYIYIYINICTLSAKLLTYDYFMLVRTYTYLSYELEQIKRGWAAGLGRSHQQQDVSSPCMPWACCWCRHQRGAQRTAKRRRQCEKHTELAKEQEVAVIDANNAHLEASHYLCMLASTQSLNSNICSILQQHAKQTTIRGTQRAKDRRSLGSSRRIPDGCEPVAAWPWPPFTRQGRGRRTKTKYKRRGEKDTVKSRDKDND